MKRTPLTRTSRLSRGGRTIKKVNPARKAKRDAAYRSFMASAEWKRIRAERIALAGGQCEALGQHLVIPMRCSATTDLTVHHKTYARFGGKELPEDLGVLCRECHNREHALSGVRPRGLR